MRGAANRFVAGNHAGLALLAGALSIVGLWPCLGPAALGTAPLAASTVVLLTAVFLSGRPVR